MADVPFLGCKISLISKCDIRYEGILYCVDAKESTIALSKVKSYGTENRGDASCFVAPKNDVYDIIIFRASDVKDLRVDAPEPPGLTDPAIISAHHSYPGQSTSSASAFNLNTNNQTTTTGAPTLNSNGSLPTSGPSNQQAQQKQPSLLPFLPTGSKDHQHQLPKQPQQQQQQQQPINYSSAVANAQRRARPDPRDKRFDENNRSNNNEPARNNSTRRDEGRTNANNNKRDDRRNERRGDERREDRRDDRREDRREDRRDDRRGGNNERRDNDGRRGDGRNARVLRGGYEGNRNHVNSNNRFNNNYNNYRRGPNTRDENSKSGGVAYRRGGSMQGQRRPRSGERTGAPRGPRKTPLKFEGEYDFDEANKLFQELEGKFKGLKLKNEEKDGESSGDGANSKSPAGPSESGSGYDSEDQNNKDNDSKDGYGESVSGEFYDKTRSFFDNISCEASERSQGKVNKPDWRKERQLNAETFGVMGNYRRGGYRGRSYGANGYHRR